MKILFIGGTGFVGKSFAYWIIKNNLNCKLTLASRNPIQTLGMEFMKLFSNSNLLKIISVNSPEIKTEIDSASHVFYGASSTDQKRYLQYPNVVSREDYDSLEYTLSTVNKRSKLMYLSSGVVNGQQKSLEGIEESHILSLWEKNNPRAIYASIKRDAEARIIRHSIETESQLLIVRLFAFCGPWLPTSKHFLIGNIIGAIEKRTALEINAKCNVYRTYYHTDTLSKILFDLSEKGKVGGDIVNIGSPVFYEMHEVGKKLSDKYMLKAAIEKIVFWNEPDIYVPSTKKLESILGYKVEEKSIYETVSEVIEQRKRLDLSCNA